MPLDPQASIPGELPSVINVAQNGWSPKLQTVEDNERIVLRVVDWFGGIKTKPPVGVYIGNTGFTNNINDAKDIKGYFIKASSSNIDSFIEVSAWGDSFIGGVGNVTVEKFPKSLGDLSGFYIKNHGYPGQSSTYIKEQFIANTTDRSDAIIIWAGKNNIADQQGVVDDIQEMVDLLDHDNYIVLAIHNSDIANEWKDAPGYDAIITLNGLLLDQFGDHFIDGREFIVSNYNPLLPDDVLAFERDTPPPSLMWDETHLNTAGNRLMADYVYERIDKLFRNSNRALTPENIRQVFNSAGITFNVSDGSLRTFGEVFGQRVTAQALVGESPANSDVGHILTVENLSMIQEGVDNPESRVITFGQRLGSAFMRLFKDSFRIRNSSDGGDLFIFDDQGKITCLRGILTGDTIVIRPDRGDSPSTIDDGTLLELANSGLETEEKRVITFGQLEQDAYLRLFRDSLKIKNADGTTDLYTFLGTGAFESLGGIKAGGKLEVGADLTNAPSTIDQGTIATFVNTDSVDVDQRIFSLGQLGANLFLRLFKDNFFIKNEAGDVDIFKFEGATGNLTLLGGLYTKKESEISAPLTTTPSNTDTGKLLTLLNTSIVGDQRILSLGQRGASDAFIRLFTGALAFRNAADDQDISRIDSNGFKTNIGDVEVSSVSKGIILHSPNNTRYRVTVEDDGTLITTAI